MKSVLRHIQFFWMGTVKVSVKNHPDSWGQTVFQEISKNSYFVHKPIAESLNSCFEPFNQ